MKKKGGSEGTSVSLEVNDDVIFGRDEVCNVRIQKQSVSAQHTKIFWDDNGLVRCGRVARGANTRTRGATFVAVLFVFFEKKNV